MNKFGGQTIDASSTNSKTIHCNFLLDFFKTKYETLYNFSIPIQWWNPRICAQNRLEMTAI